MSLESTLFKVVMRYIGVAHALNIFIRQRIPFSPYSIAIIEDGHGVFDEKGRPVFGLYPRVMSLVSSYFQTLETPIMLTSIIVRGENGIS